MFYNENSFKEAWDMPAVWQRKGTQMNDFEKLRQNAQRYKLEYPPGTRLELLKMQDPWAAETASMNPVL